MGNSASTHEHNFDAKARTRYSVDGDCKVKYELCECNICNKHEYKAIIKTKSKTEINSIHFKNIGKSHDTNFFTILSDPEK